MRSPSPFLQGIVKLGPPPLLTTKHHITTTTSSAFSWNSLLTSTFESDNPTPTIALFKQMLRMGARPNGITFSLAIRAFSLLAAFRSLMSVQSSLLRLGFPLDVFVGSTLVNAYVHVGSTDVARKVFDEMPHRDPVCWTILMNAYSRRGNAREAVGLFRSMMEEGVRPDGMVLVAGFTACARIRKLDVGMAMDGMARKSGVWFDVHVVNSMIDMYAKCGRIDFAQELFKLQLEKDTVTWNSMVTGYAESGDMAAAREIFDRIPERNEVSWSALINGHVQNGQFREALAAFREMRDARVEPNNAAITSVITACAQLGALSFGQEVHLKLDGGNICSDVVLGTALVDMYVKCGCLESAWQLFNRIRGKTLVTWNVMIMGMAVHGNASACFDLFHQLLKEGFKPNSETFTGMLSACAHAGWIRKGKECFCEMNSVYGIVPRVEHLACMVHLIARFGDLWEAFEVVKSSQISPDVVLWGALLTACNTRGNIKLGEFAAEQILILDPTHSGAYVQLCGMYARANMWKEVMNIRRIMREVGMQNRPGWSSLEIDGAVHQFHAGCSSHPKLNGVLSVLTSIDGWIQNDYLLK